jgi:hypothetical protein
LEAKVRLVEMLKGLTGEADKGDGDGESLAVTGAYESNSAGRRD